MLKKLLKYDMMSVARIWWIVALGVLGISFLGGISLRLLIDETFIGIFPLFSFFAGLFFMACVFGVIGSAVLTSILVYIRFYKHFFTDEGYLTFTLPVSRKKLFLSKTLNALIWNTAEFLLVFISVCIITLLATPAEFGGGIINPSIFISVFDFIFVSIETIGGWFFVYMLEGIIMLVLYSVLSTGIIHLCITVGAVIAKKAKVIAAIGIYYGFNTVISIASQLVSIFGLMPIANGVAKRLTGVPPFVEHGVIALELLIVCVILAALAMIVYCFTLDKLERKLNLA